MNNKTLDYYNQNAEEFVASTVAVDFNEIQDRFIEKLSGKNVLDFGCGSGRDTKYFLKAGLSVTAVDGSEEMCRYASEYTGIKVQHMLFQELSEKNTYDGIWACASILHLSKTKLCQVILKMVDALRVGGIIYTSFKYGDFEGERNGRYFTDFTIESFTKFIQDITGIQIEDYWITSDARPGRGEQKWLNLILQKE